MTAPKLERGARPCDSGHMEPRANERRWAGGRSDPVARYAAPGLGMKPQSVAHLMRDLGPRCAHIIGAFRALKDDVRLARFMAPILAALDGREAPPLVPATFELAQQADAREDIDEVAYLLTPSDQNLERLIRSSEMEILRQTARLDALKAEQNRRECQ